MESLKYPQAKDDILAFIRRHHYTHRSPCVWTHAYVIRNAKSKIQAVSMYGPAPYPSVARAFVRNQDHASRMIWQARMVGQGISSSQLDNLIQFANDDLRKQGYWWVHTLTDPTAKLVSDWFAQRAYTGEVYHRNGWLYCGKTQSKSKRQGWLIDGEFVHVRQGSFTLSQTNIHDHYPNAHTIREIKDGAKDRWVAVLGTTQREISERVLLMKYHQQPWLPMVQNVLLATRFSNFPLLACI